MGIRTPDLLHAMERRTVHHGPRQFTCNQAELAHSSGTGHLRSPEFTADGNQFGNQPAPLCHDRRLPDRNNIRIIASCRTGPSHANSLDEVPRLLARTKPLMRDFSSKPPAAGSANRGLPDRTLAHIALTAPQADWNRQPATSAAAR
jgi:hypothetical protein